MVTSQHSTLLEQTLSSVQKDYDHRVLSAVAQARKEEERKAAESREQLTLELNEQLCLAVENEKTKTKQVEQQVEHLTRVSSF